MKHRICVMIIGAAIAACVASSDSEERTGQGPFVGAPACDYPQPLGNATHVGLACPPIVNMKVVAQVIQDPDADRQEDELGWLSKHEGPPLTLVDLVIVPSSSGYTKASKRSTEHYSVQALRWVPSVTDPAAVLTPAWTAPTDWQPVDGIIGSDYTRGVVAQFAPALANGSLYMPGRFGRLKRIDVTTGAVLSTIDPFVATPFAADERTIVVSAVSASTGGTVYYTVVAFPAATSHLTSTSSTNSSSDVRSAPPRGAWLVQVRPDDTFTLVAWDTIASPAVGVPAATDLCEYPFGTSHTPKATGPASVAPKFACGKQRPAMNAPIAIGPDGTLVAYSYANNAQGAAFVVKIDGATLAPTAAYDTRGRLLHGCGVRLPIDGVCKVITANGTVGIGFDPDFNGPPRFRAQDSMANTPVIGFDGAITIAGYDGGTSYGGGYDGRGASVTFATDGTLTAKNERFGYEANPAQIKHADATYSYLQDDNLYRRFDAALGYDVFDLGTAQLSPTMALETRSTVLVPADPDKTDALDWLNANITWGTAGDHYAVHGSGTLLKLTLDGSIAESVPLLSSAGTERSMETVPGYQARDRLGRVYVSYAGTVYVVATGPAMLAPATKPAPCNRGRFRARRVIDVDYPAPPTI